MLDEVGGPKSHMNIRILDSGAQAQTRDIPQTMVCKLWSKFPLIQCIYIYIERERESTYSSCGFFGPLAVGPSSAYHCENNLLLEALLLAQGASSWWQRR